MKKFVFLFTLFFSTFYGNPKGEKIISGKVKIERGDKNLTITQKGKKAIINWDQFSIGKKETTRFSQDSSDCAILNRVIGKNRSDIEGKLSGNGHVFLLNPNGILIGKDGVIDIGSFIGSTLNISDQCFLEAKEKKFLGDSDESIINLGKIRTQKDIYLISKKVQNDGTLTSAKGSINLLGAKKICLQQEDHILIHPNTCGEVENTGFIEATTIRIEAAGGNINTLAVSRSGIIDASTIEEKDGRVFLIAHKGNTKVSGKITSNKQVHILGENIHIGKDAHIDVSSDKSDKEILIGGGYQGNNPDIPNAKVTYVEKGATIVADGIDRSDGGMVIAWGDEINCFWGEVFSRGGKIAGDGGLVEISSLGYLRYKGKACTSSPTGKTGTLLLDPSNIIIDFFGTEGSTPDFPTSGPTSDMNTEFYDPTTATAKLDAQDIIDALNGIGSDGGTNVTVRTSAGPSSAEDCGTVTINPGVVISWDTDSNFIIEADRNIIMSPGSVLQNTSSTEDVISSSSPFPIPVIDLSANLFGSSSGDFIGIDMQGRIETKARSAQLRGIGGSDDSGQCGVQICGNGTSDDGTMSTETGSLAVFGIGGFTATGSSNHGVFLKDGAKISSTGPATQIDAIILTGLASAGTAGNHGVNIENSFINSDTGAVAVFGSSSSSIGNDNYGCQLTAGTEIRTTSGIILIQGQNNSFSGMGLIGVRSDNSLVQTGTGVINISGTGGSSLGSNSNGNVGILLDTASVVESTGSMGAGSITLIGTAGEGASNNHGVHLRSDTSGPILTEIVSVGADISVTGTGNGDMDTNIGVLVEDGSEITTIYGDINIDGIGNEMQGTVGSIGTFGNIGCLFDNGFVDTHTGNITITGIGGGTEFGNDGIRIMGGSEITSQPGSIEFGSMKTGSITLTGTAGMGTSSNLGVYITDSGSSVRALSSGEITITGTGDGTSSDNMGVLIEAAGLVDTELGDIAITGTGSASGTDTNYGIKIDIGGTVSSGDMMDAGAITLHGTGGGSGATNRGICITGASSNVTSNGSVSGGEVSLTGIGGPGSGATNYGLFISATGLPSVSSIAADITINGTGGGTGSTECGVICLSEINSVLGNITIGGIGSSTGTTTNRGVIISGSAVVQNQTGNISITGQGGGTTSSNDGVIISGGAEIKTTPGSMGAGSITLIGTAGIGTANVGVLILDSGTLVSATGQGKISIIGEGRGTSSDNQGIDITTSALVMTEDGDIDIMGTSSKDGSSSNIGIRLSTATISTDSGAINLTGVGSGTLDLNNGVNVISMSEITSILGDISIDGMSNPMSAPSGTSDNVGCVFSDSLVQTQIGNINISGQGGEGSSTGNDGIQIMSGAEIKTVSGSMGIAVGSMQIGSITLTGTAGLGIAGNRGVYLTGSGSLITATGDGKITITGTSNGTLIDNVGVLIESMGLVDTELGDLKITGMGSSVGGSGSNGIMVSTGGTVSSGDMMDAGSITLIGNGAGSSNIGILVTGASSNITSNGSVSGGDVSLTGVGGSSPGSHGVSLASTVIPSVSSIAAEIIINGTGGGTSGTGVRSSSEISSIFGDITIDGTGSPTGTGSAIGVFLTGASSLIQTQTGHIDVMGSGGGSGSANDGIRIKSGAEIKTVPGSMGMDLGSLEAGSITLTGTASFGLLDNRGVYLTDSGSSITTTGNGKITITGTGNGFSSGNTGVLIAALGLVNTELGNIDIIGVGPASAVSSGNDGIKIDSGGVVSSGDMVDAGYITLLGTRGNSGKGIWITGANSNVTSNGSVSGGDISLTGEGTAMGSSSSHGVFLEATGVPSISSIAANIIIDGTGGGSSIPNDGVLCSSEISSILGDITINGTGSASGVGKGVYLSSALALIQTQTGNINITGVGKTTGGSSNIDGIAIEGGAEIRTVPGSMGMDVGSITLTGTAGLGTSDNRGVSITSNGSSISSITTTGSGNITVTGTGDGTASDNVGVLIEGLSFINTELGDIAITGTGSASGTDTNDGIRIDTGGTVSSGDMMDAGAITLIGNGNGSGATNIGIAVTGASSNITSNGAVSGGDVSLTGTGGAGSGAFNQGVVLEATGGPSVSSVAAEIIINGIGNGTSICETGVLITSEISSVLGDITISGTGSSTGTGSDVGVHITGTSGLVQTQTGDIDVTGLGGGAGPGSHGIEIADSASIAITGGSQGSGSITLTGTSALGTTDNVGVLLTDTGSDITNTGDGSIMITAIGRGSSTGNHGFAMNTGSPAVIAEDGDITIIGTSSAGLAPAYGIVLEDTSSIETDTGTVDLKGIASGPRIGFSMMDTSSVGSATQTGDIIVRTDTIWLDPTITFQSTGTMQFSPCTVGTSIGIGSSAAGTLAFTDAGLATVVGGFSSVTFGRSDGNGTVTIDTPFTFLDELIVFGKNITVDDTLMAGANDVTLNIGAVSSGTLDLNALVSTSGSKSFNGGSSSDTFNIDVATQVATVLGGSGIDALNGFDEVNTFSVTADNAGTLTAFSGTSITFSSVGNLVGGSLDDDFVFSDMITANVVDGGSSLPGEFNTLDLTAFTTPPMVLLLTPTSGLSSNLSTGFFNIQQILGATISTAATLTKCVLAEMNLSLRGVERYQFNRNLTFPIVEYREVYRYLPFMIYDYNRKKVIRNTQYL